MSKEQFLAAIRQRLNGLPQSDIDRSLEYYAEMIDDRIDDGMSPEEAVAAMGSVDEIVSQILLDTPLPKLVKATVGPKRSLEFWEILLLVLGSPVWLTLLFAAGVALLMVYIAIWMVVIALVITVFALAAAAIAVVIVCIWLALHGEPMPALLLLGTGLICTGITLLFSLTLKAAVSGTVKVSKKFIRWMKTQFIRKGESA